MKQAGVDSAVVAELLGHASTRMVDRVYGKLGRAARRAPEFTILAQCSGSEGAEPGFALETLAGR